MLLNEILTVINARKNCLFQAKKLEAICRIVLIGMLGIFFHT